MSSLTPLACLQTYVTKGLTISALMNGGSEDGCMICSGHSGHCWSEWPECTLLVALEVTEGQISDRSEIVLVIMVEAKLLLCICVSKDTIQAYLWSLVLLGPLWS